MERFIEVLSARQDELHADVYVGQCGHNDRDHYS